MFVVLMLRNGPVHIVNYRLSNGNYRTVCSKTFNKKLKMNTLAADNTFPGICVTCKSYYDEMYQSDLDVAPFMARNEVQHKYQDIVVFNQLDIEGPKAQFEDVLERRWPKLIKYQKLLARKKK